MAEEPFPAIQVDSPVVPDRPLSTANHPSPLTTTMSAVVATCPTQTTTTTTITTVVNINNDHSDDNDYPRTDTVYGEPGPLGREGPCHLTEEEKKSSKGVVTQRSQPCNGVVRNTSYPTLSSSTMTTTAPSMPCSDSDGAVPTIAREQRQSPSARKSVSTLFSSNHRKSWQCSLSNYSQDLNRTNSAQGSKETLEMQARPSSYNDLPEQISPTKRNSQQSKVFVYQDKTRGMIPNRRSFSDMKTICQQHTVSISVCGQNCAQAAGRSDSGNDSGGNSQVGDKSQERIQSHDQTVVEVQCDNPPNIGMGGATQSDDRTQWNSQSNTNSWCPDNQSNSHQNTVQVSCSYNVSSYPQTVISIPDQHLNRRPPERSFSERKPHPDTSFTKKHSRHGSYVPDSQTNAAGQGLNLSTSVSFRPHRPGNHKTDLNRHSYTEERESKREQEKQRRHSQYSQPRTESLDPPSGRWRAQGLSPELHHSSTDCPPDTQPLLPHPGVRVDGGSPDQHRLCLDNAMVRFQTMDCTDPRDRISRAERERIARAQTVPVVGGGVKASSTAESIHLGVLGFGTSSPTGSDSVTAPPLNELYRYHVFLSHCPQDAEWVREIVARLEAPPYNYKCAFSPDSPQDPASLEQALLCGAMLSERVVLVLSTRYVQETWFTFEKVLRQLTQMSLHNQRIMGVLLEDCNIPETLGELYFLDTSDPDFFDVFTKRLKTGRIPRSSESVSSDLAGRASIVSPPTVTNGQVVAQCTLSVKVGWDSYLQVVDTADDLPPSLKANGINLERPEFYAIVHNVSTVLNGSNKLPWVLCVQPLVALLLAGALWLPAFIAVLAVQVDDNSGMALPVRLIVFVFPLGIVCCGYLLKWRRRYWLSKIVRILVQNCMKANQLLYCEGRPVLTTAGHVKANNFAVYFVYFDLTDCVRSVDLLLFTCLEDDWDKLMRLVEFYARDKSFLSQVSMSERLTVMMGAAYLFKLVRGTLPHPPQQRHIAGQLCLCQFTEECVTRFVHALDREDIAALSELFTRHLFGHVSGSAVHRITTDLFHRLQ